nr:restriction endonuclease subunit S [Streptomyces sp. SID5643]
MPAGWRTLTPHDIADASRQALVIGPFGSDLKTVDYQPEGVPLVFVRDIRGGDFSNPRTFVSPEKAEELKAHHAMPGDVLITKMGNPPGDAAVYNGAGPAVITADCIRLRPALGFDARYIAYAMHSPNVKAQISAITSGVAHQKVSLDRFRHKVKIPVPPFSEQKRIVEVLEEHLSRLDAGVEYLDAAKRRSERFRVALNHRLFARYASFLKPLSSVVVIENGQTPRGITDRLTDTPTDDVVPFFKVGDMNSGDGRNMAASRYFVRRVDAGSFGISVRSAGSVLIPKRGGAIATNKKRILTTEAAYDLNTMGLRPKEPLSVDYLWRWFQGVDLGRIADGSSVPQINAKQVKSLSIPVICREKQDRLVAELDDLDGSANRLLAAVASGQKQASSLRRALFAAAFAGRLTGATSEAEQIEETAAGAVETKIPEGVQF